MEAGPYMLFSSFWEPEPHLTCGLPSHLVATHAEFPAEEAGRGILERPPSEGSPTPLAKEF